MADEIPTGPPPSDDVPATDGLPEPLKIEDELKDSYLSYAMSVIISRALPDVRDGLKPSQRRILLAMNDLGLNPESSTTKCAGIVGETMKRYHPHGDQAIYPTLVRMGQDWNMRHPLVQAQGNFGSIAGLPPAAMRYTEAKMSAIAAEMLEDLERETVDFIDNYDGKYREPLVLPSKFPNLLVNGCDGIAVGMATEIPPHNLGEVCNGLIRILDDPEVTVENLIEILPGPDFPTGGVICGRQGIFDGYRTGRGKVTLRAAPVSTRISIRSSSTRSPISSSATGCTRPSASWSRTSASRGSATFRTTPALAKANRSTSPSFSSATPMRNSCSTNSTSSRPWKRRSASSCLPWLTAGPGC